MKRSFSFLSTRAILAVACLSLMPAATALAQEESAPLLQQSGVTNAELATQKELLQAYIHLQEQLHQTQMAIESNRLDAQRSAREQAQAITEKLSAIQTALDAERTRQQEEMQRSNRTLLWAAGIFGMLGLGAIVFTTFFQWRTVNRVAELMAGRPQLTVGDSPALLTAGALAPGKAIELSNQRLMSVIERLERRVLELEHSTVDAGSGAAVDALVADDEGNVPQDAAQVTALLAKGQSFLDANEPERALACYDEILSLHPNHPEALVKKGAVLERLKQDDEALRCYDRAIQADETLTIAYLYKGGVFNRLERYNEALECYEQALRVQGGREG